MKGKRLLLGLSALGLLFAAGIRPSQNMLLAEEASSSSMPEHWTSSTLDDNNNPIASPYLSASAYKDSSKGNSIRMSRRVSAYTLSVSSSSFEAEKDTAYKLVFFYRSDCLHDEENKVTASLIETKDDGSTISTEIVSANGRESNWKQLSGYYTTSSQCASLVMVFSCYGMGDFFISGPSLAGKPAPSTFFGNFGIENGTEDSGNLQPLTASNLSDDAYSGERSIKLTKQGFRTNFDELPAGDYELRFKYKHEYEDGSRLSLRMDNVSLDGTQRLYYADPVGPNGTGGGWSTYSYKFKKLTLGSDKYCAINYIKIYSYGTFYIDDLEILNSSSFNYVAGGSFEGYNIENISLSGATGIVKNPDGSLVFAGSYDSVLGTSVEPSLKVETSNFDLTVGDTYTLKYQYRGGFSETASAYYGSDKIYSGSFSEDWTDVSVDFVASEGKDLKLQFSTSTPRTAYIRNISITDAAEAEKMPEVIKEYDSSVGESVNSFPYGDLKPDEPETSESGETSSSSSSESEETSFSQETRSEEQEESTSKPSSSSQPNASSSEATSENQNSSSGDSTATKALLGVTIAMLTVATAGLAAAIVIMIRGRKNG